MFGHQNDVISQDQKADASVQLPESTINALTNAPATNSMTDSPTPAASVPPIADDNSNDNHVDPAPAEQPTPPSIDGFLPANSAASVDNATLPNQGQPYVLSSNEPSGQLPDPIVLSDPQAKPEPAAEPEPVFEPEPSKEPTTVDIQKPGDASTDDLLKIKQHALESLSPLVGQLDLNPEDKFRTLMMLIQASDDQSLLSSAYEVAQKIEDEKNRAQALLDVVNEINYFTQNSPTEER